nr:immunoglobulin heavy chain junction region [Mus musculus]
CARTLITTVVSYWYFDVW